MYSIPWSLMNAVTAADEGRAAASGYRVRLEPNGMMRWVVWWVWPTCEGAKEVCLITHRHNAAAGVSIDAHEPRIGKRYFV